MRDPGSLPVLLVHNYYLHRGGEDEVFESEGEMLERRGHRVIRYSSDNRDHSGLSGPRLAAAAVWSRSSYRALSDLIRRERPAVVQFHNTLPLVSPAGYHAAVDGGAAVVQFVSNYRLACPNGLFLRDGKPCEDCLGRWFPWPGVVHACYRQSRGASAAVATMLAAHRAIGTWKRKVHAYIVPTYFLRHKLIETGLPPERVVLRPNMIDPDPGQGKGGRYALFAGRLSQEKGVEVLVEAWRGVGERVALKIVGDGPMSPQVEAAALGPGVEWLGRRPRSEVLELMREAAFLVVPSICYEASPLAIGEAFASGLPVLAAGHGGMASLVEDGRTGVLFRPGDAGDLAARALEMAADRSRLEAMRRAARLEFERRYSARQAYERVIEIYRAAVERSRH